MKRFLSVASLIIITLLFSNVFFLQRAFAQTSVSNFLPETNPDVPHNISTLTTGVFFGVLSTGFCVLIGSDPISQNHTCVGIDSNTGKLGYTKNKNTGGLIGFMSNLISYTYIIPVHTSPYLQYLSSSFHANGISRTYAANPNEIGIGSKGLDPILTIWIGIRNIAYLLLVIVFLVIGLGIMFRIKIDPRTVMSLQNQIPKIIIGLLLITFSFAIAGFLIDMTYVITLLFLNIVGQAVGNLGLTNSLLTSASPFDATNQAFQQVQYQAGLGGTNSGVAGAIMAAAQTVSDAVAGNLGALNIIQTIISAALIIPLTIISAITCVIGAIFGHGCDPFVWGWNSLLEIIIFFAILVAVMVALFRFWIALINAYITILFTVILGPLRILLGGIPGSPGGGFSGYIRDLLANLLIFPVSLGYIFLAAEIALKLSNTTQAGNTQAFVLPMVPGISIGPIVSLAAIMMLPKIPSAVQEALKTKDVFGSAVGQSIAVGAGAVGSGMKRFGQRAFQRDLPLQGQAEGFGRKLFMGWTPNNPWRKFMTRALGETSQHA